MTTITEVFAEMAESQRIQQDDIGFGEEGHALRAAVETAGTRNQLRTAEANLRNYYLAKLALITTEVAEAIEELRDGSSMTETYYPRKQYIEQFPESERDSYPDWVSGIFKPEGVPSELADIVIRVWSLCGEAGIDLGPIIEEKLAYNATRAHKHGGKTI